MSQAQGPGTGSDRPSATDVLLGWASKVPAPARRPSTGRGWGVRLGLVLLVVVGLALASAVAVRVLVRDPAPATDALPSRGSAPTGDAGARGTGANDAGRADPGRTDPGIHVQVTPRPDGTLDVVEQIRFLGSSTGLQVALPEAKGVVAGALPTGTRITALEVLSDGHRLPQQAAISTGGRVLLPNAPLSVELRYRLEGAATVSTPSTPGRALVLLPPIAVDDSLKRLPVVVEVSGAGVRNLVCPGLDADDQLCGRKAGSGWRTTFLPLHATAVLAQLDLTSY
jgi:hypothetical protein